MWSILRLTVIPRVWLRRDKVQFLKRYVRALLYLFNIHTLILGILACIAVYVCDRYRYSFNMDIGLVVTGTTFPLVFNIQQAFNRRERALSLIANLKASAGPGDAAPPGPLHQRRGQGARDQALPAGEIPWAQDENFPSSLGNDHTPLALNCKMLLVDLLRDVRAYLIAESPYESYAEARLCAKHNSYTNMIMADLSLSGGSQLSFQAAVEAAQKQDPATAALRRCYRGFSRLSVLNERLGLRCGYTKGGEGGMSRTNQYLRYIISNLEELRMIRDYRTPVMMRYANACLLHIFAVVLAPYFVHFCDSWISLGHDRATCPAGYSAAIVFTVITMLLFNVQQDIEQPFDMDGLDDVFFDVPDEILDDVMEARNCSTAAPSGFSTPRHMSDYGSGPLSPSVARGLAETHMPPPWMSLGAGAAMQGSVRQGSLLKPVAEEGGDVRESLSGFGSVTSSLAGGVQRVNSKEVLEAETQAWLTKQRQQQQQQQGDGVSGAIAAIRRPISPPPLQQQQQQQRLQQQQQPEQQRPMEQQQRPQPSRLGALSPSPATAAETVTEADGAAAGTAEAQRGPNRHARLSRCEEPVPAAGFSCRCTYFETAATPSDVELTSAGTAGPGSRHVTFSTAADDEQQQQEQERQTEADGPDRINSNSDGCSARSSGSDEDRLLIRAGLHSSTSVSWSRQAGRE